MHHRTKNGIETGFFTQLAQRPLLRSLAGLQPTTGDPPLGGRVEDVAQQEHFAAVVSQHDHHADTMSPDNQATGRNRQGVHPPPAEDTGKSALDNSPHGHQPILQVRVFPSGCPIISHRLLVEKYQASR